jgi:phosphoribosylaminoimidazolecarboxamide formyltransferase / IMP cyclohydrolase
MKDKIFKTKIFPVILARSLNLQAFERSLPVMATPNQKSKRAFISVFDKSNLEPLAMSLIEQYGYELLATGGTYQFLKDKGLAVQDTSDITGFTELLGGRVKSLHPEIFAGILAERSKADHTVPFYIDVVVVNLYPFESEQNTPQAKQDPHHLLHFIDIGGSALIRAAAKNWPDVAVLCNPSQYDSFLLELSAHQGKLSDSFKKYLAQAAFQRSVQYDTAISQYLAQDSQGAQTSEENATLPNTIQLNLQQIQTLRYGENPHQQAALYGLNTNQPDFTLLSGKELSFNNILDMQAGWNLVMEFHQVSNTNETETNENEPSACAIIKHNNPCGVALSNISLFDAYEKAFDCDPLSAFGGVVAFNQSVDAKTATQMKEVFLEVIIAPDFEPEAIEVLSAKKNLRLVKRPISTNSETTERQEWKQVSEHLFLLQTQPLHATQQIFEAQGGTLSWMTNTKPTPQQIEDMRFAWKVVKHVKSNGIVLAKNGKTVGIGCGQTSRIGALEIALKQACDEAKDAVMASDGFFPAVDNIHAAAQARVGAIIQPGGSIKDKDVVDLANQYQLPMAMTQIREFKH